MKVIAQRELRNDNAEVMRQVEAGETFVVTRNGAPVAEIRPVPPQRKRVVPTTELADMVRAWGPREPGAFRRDVDAALDPWMDV